MPWTLEAHPGLHEPIIDRRVDKAIIQGVASCKIGYALMFVSKGLFLVQLQHVGRNTILWTFGIPP